QDVLASAGEARGDAEWRLDRRVDGELAIAYLGVEDPDRVPVHAEDAGAVADLYVLAGQERPVGHEDVLRHPDAAAVDVDRSAAVDGRIVVVLGVLRDGERRAVVAIADHRRGGTRARRRRSGG